MLILKTSVKQSPIEGVGLFADQNIKKGDIVWQYTPDTCLIFTQSQFEALLTSFHKTERQLIQYYLTYSYYQKYLEGLIFCLDNGRFVNHSDQPNLAGPSDMPPELAWQYSVALRDIEKGEELTENYETYDSSNWLDEVCRYYDVCHYQAEDTRIASCS